MQDDVLVMTNTTQTTESTSFACRTVFSIPELRHIIAGHLAHIDFSVLVRVNSSWHNDWIPCFYKELRLRDDTRLVAEVPDPHPSLRKHGEFVQNLWIHGASYQYMENLSSSCLSCSSWLSRSTSLLPLWHILFRRSQQASRSLGYIRTGH